MYMGAPSGPPKPPADGRRGGRLRNPRARLRRRCVCRAGGTMTASVGVSRWGQLVACLAAMMAIANLQYAWTLFTLPLTQGLGATLAAIQVAFTLFVLAETWLVPFEGYLV